MSQIGTLGTELYMPGRENAVHRGYLIYCHIVIKLSSFIIKALKQIFLLFFKFLTL